MRNHPPVPFHPVVRTMFLLNTRKKVLCRVLLSGPTFFFFPKKLLLTLYPQDFLTFPCKSFQLSAQNNKIIPFKNNNNNNKKSLSSPFYYFFMPLLKKSSRVSGPVLREFFVFNCYKQSRIVPQTPLQVNPIPRPVDSSLSLLYSSPLLIVILFFRILISVLFTKFLLLRTIQFCLTLSLICLTFS